MRVPRSIARRLDALEAFQVGADSTVEYSKTRAKLVALVANLPTPPLTPERIAECIAEARAAFGVTHERSKAELLGKFRKLSGEPEPAEYTTVDDYVSAFDAWLTVVAKEANAEPA